MSSRPGQQADSNFAADRAHMMYRDAAARARIESLNRRLQRTLEDHRRPCLTAYPWRNTKCGWCWLDSFLAALQLPERMGSLVMMALERLPGDVLPYNELKAFRDYMSGFRDGRVDGLLGIRNVVKQWLIRRKIILPGLFRDPFMADDFLQTISPTYFNKLHQLLQKNTIRRAILLSNRMALNGTLTARSMYVVGYTLQSIQCGVHFKLDMSDPSLARQADANEEGAHSVAYVRCGSGKWVLYDDNEPTMKEMSWGNEEDTYSTMYTCVDLAGKGRDVCFNPFNFLDINTTSSFFFTKNRLNNKEPDIICLQQRRNSPLGVTVDSTGSTIFFAETWPTSY